MMLLEIRVFFERIDLKSQARTELKGGRQISCSDQELTKANEQG